MNIYINLLNDEVPLPYSRRQLKIKKTIKTTSTSPYLTYTAGIRFIQLEGTSHVI